MAMTVARARGTSEEPGPSCSRLQHTDASRHGVTRGETVPMDMARTQGGRARKQPQPQGGGGFCRAELEVQAARSVLSCSVWRSRLPRAPRAQARPAERDRPCASCPRATCSACAAFQRCHTPRVPERLARQTSFEGGLKHEEVWLLLLDLAVQFLARRVRDRLRH